MNKYKLLIVEDDSITREVLKRDLKTHEEIELLNAVKNGKEAYDFVKLQEPDVILMDIEMPVMDGITATKNIKEFNSDIKVIMLTSHKERNNVLWSFSSGANAYCVKNIKTPELINIIKIVSDGGVWFDNQIAQFVFEILKNITPTEDKEEKKNIKAEYNITKREKNIIKMISEGYSNIQIAEQLCLSPNTVRNHIANITQKLAVQNRTQITSFASKNKEESP